MEKPFQDSSGYVYFPTQYAACETARLLIKARDRDGGEFPTVYSAGTGPYRVGAGTSGRRYTARCNPDGLAHRYAAYANMKTPDGGTLILKTDEVYFKSTPVSSCGPFNPPADF